MRALVQRVRQASVSVDDQVVGAIGRGYVVLLGVTHGDGQPQADWLADKIAGLRLFEDDEGKMNRSLEEIGGELLVVSQFTLYGDARKGRRPSFTSAAPQQQAEPLVEHFVDRLRREHGLPVATGVFGAMMLVKIYNEGPVTLMLEREAAGG